MSTFKDEIMTPEVPFEMWTTPQWILVALVAITGLATYAYLDSITRPFIEFLFDEYYRAWQRAFIALIGLVPIVTILPTLVIFPITIPRHMDASFGEVALAMSPYLLTGIIAGIRARRYFSVGLWPPAAIGAIPIIAAAYGVGTDRFTRQAADLNMSSLELIFTIVVGIIAASYIWAKAKKGRRVGPS